MDHSFGGAVLANFASHSTASTVFARTRLIVRSDRILHSFQAVKGWRWKSADITGDGIDRE